MQTDRQLAEHLAKGSNDALGEIFIRYGDRLHDYCRSVVRSPHDAADAVQETFLLAAERVGQLRDPAKLRPWLYAIARNECLRRVRNQPIPVDELSDVAQNSDLGASAHQQELSSLISDAAAGLDPRDRAVLDLQLRHELEGQELADALGVKLSHSYVLVGRVRERVERSLVALLVARRGRRDCTELEVVLGNWDGTLSPRLRKRLARHIDECDICERTRAKTASPLALLAALPIIPAPPELHAQLTSYSSNQHLGSSRSASEALELDSRGFPRATRGRLFWARGLVAFIVTTTVVAVMTIFLLVTTDSRPIAAPDTLELTISTTTTAGLPATSSSVVEPDPEPALMPPSTDAISRNDEPEVPTTAPLLAESEQPEPDPEPEPEPEQVPDTISPQLQNPRLSSATLVENAGKGCQPATATLWVFANDDQTGIEEVSAFVSAGTYESVIQLEQAKHGDDATYVGTIGPFPSGIAIRGSAGIIIEITAFDYARNETITRLVVKLVPC